jgi:polyferredoxin
MSILKRRRIKAIHLRRFSQIIFLLAFILLFLSIRDPLQKALPANLFLRLDPLAGLAVLLSGRIVVAAFYLSAILLVGSFALGRSFCGWVCPLGTTLDVRDRLFPAGNRRGERRWKYAVLAGFAVLSLISIQAVWLLDPLVLLSRTFTLSLYPIAVWGFNGLVGAGYNYTFTEKVSDALWNFFQGWLIPLNSIQTGLILTTTVIFVGILLLDHFGRRYWCRVLCPLGALLGLISRFSPFGRRVNEALCTSCAVCAEECRMHAIRDDFIRTRRDECILCLECSDLCAVDATTFSWNRRSGKQEALNPGRRRMLGTIAAAAAFGAVWKTQLTAKSADGFLIRPPGAVTEEDFLDLCLRCEACVKACSATGGCLQPAGFEHGISGFWTPRADMRRGYCEYSCTLCGQVCPSGAIKPLDEETKKRRVIGLAYIDRSRCIPWERGEECIVCEEHCPLPRKAIQFRIGDVELPNRTAFGVKLPYVDRDLCIGCGICETRCPTVGNAAIRITREGEQREQNS